MSEQASSAAEHQKKAAEKGPVRLAVITVSDTRSPENDTNGQWLRAQIAASGHVLVEYRIVKDDPAEIGDVLESLLATDAQILLFNGGTGISPRDNTFDALAGKLEKTLPGFGELFRILSYDQVGAAAMLSRAVAGVYRGRVLFSTPGSHAAVKLAWEKLISPELHHLAWEVRRNS
jgi:molybdenum cofactor biosynthesis protein B